MKKITDPIEIYKLRESGLSVKEICEKYDISRGTYQTTIKKACTILGIQLVKNTTLGQKRTEEQKSHMRKSKSDTHRKNISNGRKGYTPKKESIDKWKKSMEKTGYSHLKSKEYRKAQSKRMKGKKKSQSHCMKMSEIMKGKAYNNYKRGFHYSDKAGRIFYRSSLELKTYIVFDNDKSIKTYKTEPFSIEYEFNKNKRRYIPDILTTKNDGSKVLFEIKPHQEVKWPINLAKFNGAIKYCKDNSMKFKIMTEKHLDSIIGKRGELLETLTSILDRDNQQPSTLNELGNNVGVKVQRLTGEENSTNKPDTSAPHSSSHNE